MIAGLSYLTELTQTSHLERGVWLLISQVHHTPLIYVPGQIEWTKGEMDWGLWEAVVVITSSKLCSDLCGLLSASLICLGNWPKGIILMNWSSVALHALKVNWSELRRQFAFGEKARRVYSQQQVYMRVRSMLRGIMWITYSMLVPIAKVMARE